jgi:glycosyltransferase involved in cell wall biosynthesis
MGPAKGVAVSAGSRDTVTVGHVMYFDPANYPPVINACRVQAARGFSVHLVGYYRGLHRGFGAGSGIVERYLNEPPGFSPRTMREKLTDIMRFRREVARWAQAVRPDVVVAHDLHGYWGATELLGRLPIVLHVHDMPNPDGGGPVGRLDRIILKYAMRQVPRASGLVMPEASRLKIAEEWWQFRGPSFVVANCPLLGEHRRNTILRDLIWQRTRQTPEWVVVRAGGAGPAHLIEETVLSLRFAPDGLHLCLIGCGDERYMATLGQLAKEMGVEGRVHQFPSMSYDDMRGYLRSADVGLAIYRCDARDINKRLMGTASAKHLEYVAAGIPSLLSDQQSFRNLGARTGAVIVAREAAEAIAESMLTLTRDPELYRRLSNLAREAHKTEYHYEHQYAPVCSLIEAYARRAVSAAS